MRIATAPTVKVRALDLIEWHGRKCAVDLRLDELVAITCKIGLGADPLGCSGGLRPQHDHRFGFGKVALDHIGVSAMGRKLGVPPQLEPRALELPRETARDRFIGPCITDEDVRHARAPA
jgi:hypothetical protein